jgi:hypothetical protein
LLPRLREQAAELLARAAGTKASERTFARGAADEEARSAPPRVIRPTAAKARPRPDLTAEWIEPPPATVPRQPGAFKSTGTREQQMLHPRAQRAAVRLADGTESTEAATEADGALAAVKMEAGADVKVEPLESAPSGGDGTVWCV